MKLLIKGLTLSVAYKIGSKKGVSFSGYLLERVRKGRKAGDTLFAIRLFMAELDLARLAKVAGYVDGLNLKLAKHEWMALIESQIWEKGGNVARLIEASSLNDSVKRSYKVMAYFYAGELRDSELAKFNPTAVHSTWLWYLKELFVVYALCKIGRGEQAEKVLIDVIKRDPAPFMEFQDRFERTGYKRFHILGADG